MQKTKPECEIERLQYGIISSRNEIVEILNNNGLFIDAIEFENRINQLFKLYYQLMSEYVQITEKE
jgi:hypothetical protein